MRLLGRITSASLRLASGRDGDSRAVEDDVNGGTENPRDIMATPSRSHNLLARLVRTGTWAGREAEPGPGLLADRDRAR